MPKRLYFLHFCIYISLVRYFIFAHATLISSDLTCCFYHSHTIKLCYTAKHISKHFHAHNIINPSDSCQKSSFWHCLCPIITFIHDMKLNVAHCVAAFAFSCFFNTFTDAAMLTYRFFQGTVDILSGWMTGVTGWGFDRQLQGPHCLSKERSSFWSVLVRVCASSYLPKELEALKLKPLIYFLTLICESTVCNCEWALMKIPVNFTLTYDSTIKQKMTSSYFLNI